MPSERRTNEEVQEKCTCGHAWIDHIIDGGCIAGGCHCLRFEEIAPKAAPETPERIIVRFSDGPFAGRQEVLAMALEDLGNTLYVLESEVIAPGHLLLAPEEKIEDLKGLDLDLDGMAIYTERQRSQLPADVAFKGFGIGVMRGAEFVFKEMA